MTEIIDDPTAALTVEAICSAGETLLKSGAPLLAYDRLSAGLVQFPASVRLRQLCALALARSGASEAAAQILEALRQEQHVDEETLGLLGRAHKDLWLDGQSDREAAAHLQSAFDCYSEAHRLSDGYWTGINAATLALFLDDRSAAIALARGVRELCVRTSQVSSDGDRYWLLATLGEAALILGEVNEAEDWYGRAAAVAGKRFGDVASTRRNARLIVGRLEQDGSRIEALLRVPPVIVFAGHLLDRPGRASPRFPGALEPAVRRALERTLGRMRPACGYASAACGADILFLERLLEVGGEPHVVLPYNRDRFLKDCVNVAGADTWRDRCERVLERAVEIVIASPEPIGGARMAFEYAFRVLDGAAAVRADALDTDLIALAVWDGRPGDGPGGTASAVEYWRAVGRELQVIDLAEIQRAYELTPIVEPSRQPAPDSDANPHQALTFDPQIVAILFADAKGFSRLGEDEIPRFVEHFLGTVAHELDSCDRPPLVSNTWGDGLYAVFDDIQQAGRLGLRLCEAVLQTDWTAKGLSHDLSLRVGLHAGPAYACIDPITKRPNYLGVHVSRAARIEPITPPGHVYTSAAFVALARSSPTRSFGFTYVGQMSQAKGYGVFPTYVLRRLRRESSASISPGPTTAVG